ncbi:MAG: Flp pilus assembly complex ATPase component TadA [Proteobacteria bacterium]|nr:Flp pilus assembly complex ATPase component TadA [Pseudomonadota bacterium]
MQTDVSKSQTAAQKIPFDSRFKNEIKLAKLFRSSKNFNELLIGLKQEMRHYFAAQAFTIYVADNKKKEIVSRIKAGRLRQEIRLPIDKSSLAGFTALTGRTINVADPYNEQELQAIDPEISFNREWDDKTKFTTRQVLSAPIYTNETLYGVIQLLNKKNKKKFTDDEEQNLTAIAEALGRFITEHRPTHKKAVQQKPKIQDSQLTSKPYTQLITNGVISEDELVKALSKADEENRDIEKVLIDDFDLSRKQLGLALAEYYGVKFEDLTSTIYNPIDFIKGKNIDFFLRGLWVPLHSTGDELILAINDPHNNYQVQEVQQLYRSPKIELRFSLKEDIIQFLQSFKGAMKSRSDDKSVGDILDELKDLHEPLMAEDDEFDDADVNDSAVVLLVRKIIEDANYQMASDIHIEPYGNQKDAVVRYRIDGRCQNALTVPRGYIKSVVSRIKVMAKIDIAEKRKPQDGKIRFRTTNNRIIELRVATVPTTGNNEDVVLRLLASAEPIPLDQMMRQETFERFKGIIQKPYGIIMVVGPTGCGKTTTLHSALNFINTPER